ncbi:Putative cell wall binding repeat-containing protein [Lachnospiraceae bacterium]|nr:Putative cell wall binding repeat-containing protein [Lachnospiraceae bacterium]
MNKSHSFKRIISFILAILIVAAFIPSAEVNAASKKGWVTKKGYKYYYNEEGKLQTGFVEIKGSTYYFAPSKMTAKVDGKKVTIAPKGAMLKGWYKIKKKYYYFNRSNGKMAVNKTVDSIKVDKKGVAKKSSFYGKKWKKKIDTMILARERMQSLTKPTDKSGKKLRKCYEYIKGLPYIGYHFLKNERDDKTWDLLFAADALDVDAHKTHILAGECTAYASALAYLALECGYETVYIVDDDRTLKGDNHSWVEIKGKIYDPLFARTSGKGGDDANFAGKYSDTDFGHVKINTKNVSTGKEKHSN